MADIDEDKFKADALKAAGAEEIKARAEKEEAEAEQERAEAEREEAAAIKEKAKAVGKAGLEAAKAGAGKIASGASVGGAMAGAGLGYLAGKSKSWFATTDIFLIVTFLLHYFFEVRSSNPTFTLVLNIVIAIVAWIWLFKSSPDSMPIILLVFGLEVGLPLVADAFPFLLEIYGVKWLFVSQLWPWWSYMALVIGERTKFNQFMLLGVILFWVFFLLQQGDFMREFAATTAGVGSEETEEFKAEAKKLQTSALDYLRAWWDCHMPPGQNCTRYKELTGEIEVVRQTGEEIEVTPTMVELEVEKTGGVFTSEYLNNTGLSIVVDVIRGNDRISIDGNIGCSFKNNSANFTGSSSPNNFHVGEEVLAGMHTTNALCKSTTSLEKGDYEFVSEISFNQEAHSTLKNYFMNKEVPETNSMRKAPYYQEELTAKMDEGIMEVDLSLNRRSPIKIGIAEKTSLPLQILFLNKGKGKIKKLSELCLSTSYPLFVKNSVSWDAVWDSEEAVTVSCLKDSELENLNFMLKEQEKQGQIPRYIEELEIIPGEDLIAGEQVNVFPDTNNPFDLNIDADVKYKYSLEEDTKFKIIS